MSYFSDEVGVNFALAWLLPVAVARLHVGDLRLSYRIQGIHKVCIGRYLKTKDLEHYWLSITNTSRPIVSTEFYFNNGLLNYDKNGRPG